MDHKDDCFTGDESQQTINNQVIERIVEKERVFNDNFDELAQLPLFIEWIGYMCELFSRCPSFPYDYTETDIDPLWVERSTFRLFSQGQHSKMEMINIIHKLVFNPGSKREVSETFPTDDIKQLENTLCRCICGGDVEFSLKSLEEQVTYVTPLVRAIDYYPIIYRDMEIDVILRFNDEYYNNLLSNSIKVLCDLLRDV